MLFDIDPYIYSGHGRTGAEPELNTIAFEKGKEVAFWLRELLASMSLEAIVKTSGKTGLHVFVPIRRTLDFDAARHVSELVGRHLMRAHPKDITLDWSVPKRTGKIFMDYNMNVRGKTLNVAYSPRGEPGAPVSMPLTWEELAGAHPLDFRITNAAERLAQTGDRWADALERKQSLEKALGGAKAEAGAPLTRAFRPTLRRRAPLLGRRALRRRSARRRPARLLQVCDQVGPLLPVLDAGVAHRRSGNGTERIGEKAIECRFAPDDSRAAHRLRVVEAGHRSGAAGPRRPQCLGPVRSYSRAWHAAQRE